jgi:hypothetical protein
VFSVFNHVAKDAGAHTVTAVINQLVLQLIVCRGPFQFGLGSRVPRRWPLTATVWPDDGNAIRWPIQTPFTRASLHTFSKRFRLVGKRDQGFSL